MNFFRSLWDKFVEKYIEFVGLNPSEVYKATADEFRPQFEPINCRCQIEPIKSGENMLTLKYENGRLYYGYDSFNCDDSVDMELLCNKVNQNIIEDSIEKERALGKLSMIKEVMD